MEWLVVLALLGSVVPLVMMLSFLSHQQWVAVWRGHRIRVRLQKHKVFLEVDDEIVMEMGQGIFKNTYEAEWEHPALGNTKVQIKRVIKGQDGVHITLQIGEEIIPLIELPQKWNGNVDTNQLDAYWDKLLPTEFESLGDPRWIAACKLLQLVRQSQMADQDIREAANILQQELRKSFETRRRLAEDDLLTLGDSQKLAELRLKIEENITQGLEAVKSLHMVTISLEAHADESIEMHKVHQIIETLHAEEEVEKFMHEISREEEEPAEKRKEIAKRELQDRKI